MSFSSGTAFFGNVSIMAHNVSEIYSLSSLGVAAFTTSGCERLPRYGIKTCCTLLGDKNLSRWVVILTVVGV